MYHSKQNPLYLRIESVLLFLCGIINVDFRQEKSDKQTTSWRKKMHLIIIIIIIASPVPIHFLQNSVEDDDNGHLTRVKIYHLRFLLQQQYPKRVCL